MRRACSPAALLLALVLAACGAAMSRTADDASLSTRVKVALLNQPGLADYRLDARTFQGVVTLSGTVKTQAEADRAVAAARRVHGVRDVRSEIQVQTPNFTTPNFQFGSD